MKRHRFKLKTAALASFLAVAGAASRADAQTIDGWALNRFEPTPAGDAFFFAEHPWYSSTRRFAAGLFVDHAFNPLINRRTIAGNTTTTEIVSGMLTGHIAGAFSFADRVGVSLSLPVSLYQSGTAFSEGTLTLAPADGPAVGDLRIGARVRVLGQADRDAFSLHVGLNFWAPIGSRVSFTGDEAIRLEPRLTAAGRVGPLRYSLGFAFLVRSDLNEVNLAIGNELRMTAALGFVALDDRLTIGPEVYLLSSLRDLPNSTSSAFLEKGQWGGEAILGVHYLLADTFSIGAGGGVGLEQGFGIPAGRVLFSLAYAPVQRAAPPPPPPADTDGDGVLDPNDQCVNEPQGPRPDPARTGCPSADTDRDGVLDPDDQCVNEPQGASPDPARPGCPQRDADSDGVLDGEDQCVNEPQGATPDPARRGCPAGDRDHDSVLDPADQCPDEPQGAFPDPARAGCPLPDRDHDTVPDATDHCPDQPGAPSTDPNLNGCPGIVVTTGTSINILEQVFFDTNRATIKRRSFRVLERVADVLRASPHIHRVRIEGHTDNRSTPDHNLQLSQQRATSVLEWLATHNVPRERLDSRGFGQTCPIDSNDTNAGRARNRRVAFTIVDPAPPGGVPEGCPGSATTPAAPTTPAATPDAGGAHGRRGRHRRRH